MIYHHSKGKNQFYSPKIQYFSNSLNQFIDYNWVPTDFMLNQWSNLILTLKIRQRLFILKRFSPPTVLLSPLSAIAAWNIQIFISLIARSSHVGTAKIWSSTFQSITIWSFVLNGGNFVELSNGDIFLVKLEKCSYIFSFHFGW